MRYIGGKSLLLNSITDAIQNYGENIESVIDIFSGSGVVGNHLKSLGYNVLANDFLYFSYVIARGTLGINAEPLFGGFDFDVIDYLNNIKLEKTRYTLEQCFVYKNYSPNENCERMYFQKDNAIKIDLIRLQIETWKNEGLLTEDEYFYLLAALINAVPYVANITGVFGAYLKYWDARTYNELHLERPVIIPAQKVPVCHNKDYKEILPVQYDLLYADPPYNSREYLPNYHVLETIARYDYPEVKGVAGLRDYANQKSSFCKKNTVHDAFETLIRDCKSRYILISYNNEGLLSTEDLTDLCRKYALDDSFRLLETDYRRYKNKIPNNKAGLKEQLYFLRRQA
ncbi:MAG: DNA adenine methylase [Muribaculaceae bacterium]|nr:DNA adenine methylase [Muribaculaceae bacterium]MCM1494060.1 DNA adenine methylase [Muribaculaceae bacterium]